MLICYVADQCHLFRIHYCWCVLFQAKINNAMQLGFSYQHELSNGVTMTASTLLEGKNFNAGGHKIGFGLDFDL